MTALDKMLGEVEGSETWWTNQNRLYSCDCLSDTPSHPAFEPFQAIKKSAFDRVCAALKVAIEQRDAEIPRDISDFDNRNLLIEEYNKTIAQILKGEK